MLEQSICPFLLLAGVRREFSRWKPTQRAMGSPNSPLISWSMTQKVGVPEATTEPRLLTATNAPMVAPLATTIEAEQLPISGCANIKVNVRISR